MPEKRKNSSFLIVLCIILTLGIIIFVLVRAGIQKYCDNPLKNIVQESDDIPNYVIYGTLYSNYGIIDLEEICEKQNEYYYLSEIFCVKGEKVYFVYEDYNDTPCWAIGSVDLVTSEFQTCCKMSAPAESYKTDFHSAYEERNGYYFDGQITLTDHKTVLTYDIDSQIFQTYMYRDYCFPKCTVYGKGINDDTIRLNIEGFTKTYTLEEMAEKSAGIAEIFALKDKKTTLGSSYLSRCFASDCVQVTDGKIYAVGECLNRGGYAYAVIYEYDEENDSWMYVTNTQTPWGDIVGRFCYVIP